MDKWKVCDQTMNQSEKILEIKDLCVEFKTVEGTVKAINHLNYTLHKGEKLGIVGESGSGKSVSSLGIMQLIPNPPGEIVGGEILYKGQDLVKKSEKDMQKIRGNEISMIFQEPMTSLNPIIKCGRQIAESLRLHRGMNKKEAMLSMEEGPYYAIKAGEDMLITHGGIRVNERFEALGGDYKPVENLYVAGVDFGGADADVYNVVMSGHGFGFAVNSGRIAGENAVKALK